MHADAQSIEGFHYVGYTPASPNPTIGHPYSRVGKGLNIKTLSAHEKKEKKKKIPSLAH
jgi:hypothetical protein